MPEKLAEETFFESDPEFLITHSAPFRSDPKNIEAHLESGDDLEKPTLENAQNIAKSTVESRGGVTEIWKRVGMYKAAAQEWN